MKKTLKECIIVTGASGKIGSYMSSYLLRNGYDVLGISRKSQKIIKYGSNPTDNSYGDFYELNVDLTSSNIASILSAKIEDLRLKPVGLINNARNVENLSLNADGSTARINFEAEHLLNVVIPYEISLEIYNKFLSLRSIVNIGSIYGSVAMNHNLYTDKYASAPIHYGVSKAALIHLTKELSVRFSTRKVAVNWLSFGGIRGREDTAFETRYAQLCPNNEMLTEGDVLHHIKYLIHPDFSGMTGQNLIVDGGWTVW